MTLYGIGASGGKGEGKIKMISSINDFELIEEGDVVVTKSATPDFILILSKIACLIADEGGMTSHIAIVCREMETPAIVGTKNGSSTLKNGQFVEFDCSIGIVKTKD
jgi:pyruvate,water dikinase